MQLKSPYKQSAIVDRLHNKDWVSAVAPVLLQENFEKEKCRYRHGM